MTKPSSASPFDLHLIAHDLRHLMGLVHGHAELLEGCTQDEAAMHKGLSAIRKAAARASSVCEDLLYFGNQREEAAQSVDFEQILASVIEICGPSATERGIQLVVTCCTEPAGAVDLQGDALALERAILNLTWNALDAVQGASAAEIELRWGSTAAGGPFWVEVADTGPGLPDALLGDLTSHGPGPDGAWPSSETGRLHGFGLVLSALVARRHQGSLCGRARRHGSGAVLRLEIPHSTPERMKSRSTRNSAKD
jgi:C4-dicarboxylate-specific signal transduction histidine kinase